MRHNNLTKLPNEICELSNLEVLEIPFNGIKQIPDRFDRLQALKELYIAHNELMELPMSLTKLAALEHIDFCGNPDLSWKKCFFKGNKYIEDFRKLLQLRSS